MTDTHKFEGKMLCGARSQLGEGPTYDPATDIVWWLNILDRELHELHLASGRKRVHALPMMASVLARVDDARQLLATEHGLFLRDAATGGLTRYADLETGKPGNRSNDGRTHPSGALWIGTMGKRAEDRAGAIYHVARGKVTTLFGGISIPNSICFSPDGSIGYFADTRVNKLMRVALDPATSLPVAEPTVLVDTTGEKGGLDGSVCDADGHIWNARWGASAVDRYAPDGRRVARYQVPARQATCPAFIGKDASRMLVTSAWEGMDDAAKAVDPEGGATFELGIEVKGVIDPPYAL